MKTETIYLDIYSINLGDLVWLIRLKKESEDIRLIGLSMGSGISFIENIYINSEDQLCYVKSRKYSGEIVSRETIITDLSYSSFVKKATSILPEVLSQIFQ